MKTLKSFLLFDFFCFCIVENRTTNRIWISRSDKSPIGKMYQFLNEKKDFIGYLLQQSWIYLFSLLIKFSYYLFDVALFGDWFWFELSEYIWTHKTLHYHRIIFFYNRKWPSTSITIFWKKLKNRNFTTIQKNAIFFR